MNNMKKIKKILIWTSIIIVLVLVFLVYWNYYSNYSEGNRAGILQKFSKKGNLFKTYEGELIMSSIASTGSTTIASEKFLFSVKQDSIAKALFDMEGQNVTLHYVQKRHHLPWTGNTDYYVVGVKKNE